MKIIYYVILSIVILTTTLFSKNVEYTLNLSEKIYKEDGKTLKSIMINNQNMGPVLKAKQGDTLEINVVNNTNIDTTMHFHGVLLPNGQDGVGGVTQKYIKPNQSFKYRFEVKQEGTYWYHAHGLEKAQGIYGGIVFGDDIDSKKQNVLVYSGKFDKNPEDVFKSLTSSKASNFCSSAQKSSWLNSSKKDGSMQNGDMMAMHHGDKGMKGHHKSAKKGGKNMMMHYSDVGYKKHSINASDKIYTIENNENEKEIKLRVINAYTDGFLNFVYSGADIKVVASDGIAIKPFKTKTLQVAMGETYDIIVKTDKNKSYELVSFMLGTNDYSKVIVGKGELVKLKSYNYKDYKIAPVYNKIKTITPYYLKDVKSNKVVNYNFSLEGSHMGYNWQIKDHEKQIKDLNLKVGDKVVIKLKNNTMMPHPMHLHGMYFKVTSAKNNLIKHTYNMEPKEEITIEFTVDEEGKWLFHCHNLFHMASSMIMTINVEK